MYVMDEIVYAGEQVKPIKVCGVRPMENHLLWLRFTTGEVKLFDVKPLLSYPAYSPLKNEAIFRNVYIDYGVTVWNDGDIDIAPETLYEQGTDISDGGIGA